jgi:membrane protein DedA with SNARE-associated domain
LQDIQYARRYALLFFWILAEQGALPLPSAPLLLACGALAKDGRLTPHWIVFTGLAACLVTDNVWFMLRRRRGAKVLRFICRVALGPDSCVPRRRPRSCATAAGPYWWPSS